MRYLVLFFFSFKALSHDYKDAGKAVAKATYKQSGMEKNVNELKLRIKKRKPYTLYPVVFAIEAYMNKKSEFKFKTFNNRNWMNVMIKLNGKGAPNGIQIKHSYTFF